MSTTKLACPHRPFIDILFLGAVNAHERFDGLDDALRVAHRVAVGGLQAQARRESRKQARRMLYLAMRAAHGGEQGGIAKVFGDLRIDRAFVLAFVADDVLRHQPVGFLDEGARTLRLNVVERVGDLPQPVERGGEVVVGAVQVVRGGGRQSEARHVDRARSTRAAR